MLERCLALYPIQRVIVVADRGLLSLDNLAKEEKLTLDGGRPLEYILAVPASRYKDFGQWIEAMDFAEQSESVREGTWAGRRLVVAHNPNVV